MRREHFRLKYALELSRHIKGFGWYLTLAILCNMAFKLLPLLTSLTVSYLVVSVVGGQTGDVTRMVIAVGVLVLLTSLFSYLDVQVSHDMAYRILAQLRNQCYDKLDALAPAALVGERSGDMLSIILGDVETLEWFYAHTIGQLIVAVAVPLAALVFMGAHAWVLPVVVLPFIAVMIWIPRHSARLSDDQGTEVKRQTGTLNAVIIDGVQGLKDIISFRWQQSFFRKFMRTNDACERASLEYAIRRGDESRAITVVMEAAVLATDVVIVMLTASGKLSTLSTLPMFVLSSAIYSPIQEALAMSTNYGLIFGAAERVLGLFAMKPLVEDRGSSRLDRTDYTEVRFTDVHFAYPEAGGEEASTPVLNGLAFSFHTGESVALVGASGSGKSTAARLLQRFWDVDAGGIEINGKDIRDLTLASLREAVTVVPQEVYLFNLSIKENLRLAKADATDAEIRRAAELACADGFIQSLPDGYDTQIGERGLRLSGGERQRLAIAQAFLKDAPVLVLDEASANLDAENERLINRAVEALKKGRATLVIAHRLSTIRSADRVIFIRDGRTFAQGTYSELMESCPEFVALMGEKDDDEADE